MKQKMKSLRIHMLLPVIAMTLFIVILLTMLFSRSYTGMILQREREINAVGFETISRSITPLIESSISEVRSVMSDEPVSAYARHQFNSLPELVHARIRCRDYLLMENRREGFARYLAG